MSGKTFASPKAIESYYLKRENKNENIPHRQSTQNNYQVNCKKTEMKKKIFLRVIFFFTFWLNSLFNSPRHKLLIYCEITKPQIFDRFHSRFNWGVCASSFSSEWIFEATYISESNHKNKWREVQDDDKIVRFSIFFVEKIHVARL